MQTELKAETAAALQAAVQGLTDDMIEEMKVSPLRQFEPTIVQDPLVYRLYEVGDGTHQAGVLWACKLPRLIMYTQRATRPSHCAYHGSTAHNVCSVIIGFTNYLLITQ